MDNQEYIYLPDPSKKSFGMRASRWARDISMGDENSDDESNGMVCISKDPNALFDVTIGYWNTKTKARHMELDIRIHRVEETETVESDLGSSASSGKSTDSKMEGATYILNAYMGGDFSHFHFYDPKPGTKASDYAKENFWNDDEHAKKTRAPFAIAPDAKERWFGFFSEHHFFEERRMTASEFASTLKKFLRWGYVIGKSDVFKFQPFFFMNNIAQKATNENEDADIRFINCQSSVAMATLWWMREFDRLENNETEESYDRNIEIITEGFSRKIIPRIDYKARILSGESPFKWKETTKKEAQQALKEFLEGSGVELALSEKFNEENVDKEISEGNSARRE